MLFNIIYSQLPVCVVRMIYVCIPTHVYVRCVYRFVYGARAGRNNTIMVFVVHGMTAVEKGRQQWYWYSFK